MNLLKDFNIAHALATDVCGPTYEMNSSLYVYVMYMCAMQA